MTESAAFVACPLERQMPIGNHVVIALAASTERETDMNIFRTLVPTLAGMVLACASWSAQAAAAVAVASNNKSYTALEYRDLERAKAEALRGCRQMGSNCKLTVWTSSPGAIALATGKDGNAQAIEDTPEKARDTALRACRRLYKGCQFSALYWEPGERWAAWAVANDAGGSLLYSYFIYEQSSEAAAREEALRVCNSKIKDQPGATCKVVSHLGSWTRAVAKSASATAAYVGERRQEVEAEALRVCRAGSTPGDQCALDHVALNPGPVAAPASFAKVAAQTLIEKEKAQAARRPMRSATQQGQVLSCTNRCVNGSCVRSFPDGRTERWQAPRVYDALKNDWKWDTSSCGG